MSNSKELSTESKFEENISLTPEGIIHALPTANALIDHTGKIIEHNSGFETLLYSKEAKSDLVNLIESQEQKDLFSSQLDSRLETISLIVRIGIKYEVDITLTLINTDCKSAIYLASAKELIRINDSLHIQELINSIPDIVYIKDSFGKYVIANTLMAKILGVNNSETIKGKTDFEFYDEQQAKTCFEEEQNVINTEVPLLNKSEQFLINGETKWFSMTKIPLNDNTGKVIGLIGVGRDISHYIDEKESLKKAWQEAEKADKLKSTFLANLSHEIRTPLNGILGFSQFLKQKSHSVEKQHKYLDIIHNNGQQLLMLLNDIIDISMIESDQVAIKKQQFRINGLLDHLYTNFDHQIKEKKVDIELISKPGLDDKNDLLFSDDYRLHQVLGNLIGNSLKFTKSGKIEYGYILEEKTLVFFVSDTGIGISKDQLKDIFKRFRQADESITRKYGGTGLGLSICQGLVEMLGGEIWLESTPGKGSTFFFSIPYVISEK